MEITEVLKQAAQAVKDADLDEEFRQVAFAKSVDILSRQGPAWTGSSANSDGPAGKATPAAAADGLERIAHRLKLDLETVRQVYDLADGDLNIVIGAGKLDKRAAAGTKQLALLVAAGRQAAGLDADWTPVSEIRKWAETFKRLDSGNFATTLKELDDEFTFNGSGQQRKVRLSRPGWERVAELVVELGNGGKA